MLLLLLYYTILGSIPKFDVQFNYITWFSVLFIIASYIRLYPQRVYEKSIIWKWTFIFCVMLALGSVVVIQHLSTTHSIKADKLFFFVSDSNKILAVIIAISSFLWFMNIKMKYHKYINAFGGSTFGVLLIHANSDAMRTWLWKETMDCVGHYNLHILNLVLFCIGGVLIVFIVCNLIDQVRIQIIEKPILSWLDKNVFNKTNTVIEKTDKYLYG